MSNLRQEGNKLLLCCGSKRCPSLEIVDNNVILTDDDKNSVKLTVEQASLINEALQKLTK